MATKRPFTHPSRQDQVPGEAPEPSRKRLKKLQGKPSNLSGKQSFKKAHTVHDLKSNIRSLRRLLESGRDLPATVREEKRRALQSAETELRAAERAKKRSEVIGRWHKVRFFERRKAEKRVKALRKEVEVEDEDDAAAKRQLEEQLEEAEVDVAYAIYFPLEREYMSLFPKRRRKDEDAGAGSEASPEAEDEGTSYERQGDKAMWDLVKKCMADGTLADLREGRLLSRDGEDEEAVATKPIVRKAKPKAEPAPVFGNRRERRKAAAAAKPESEDEDGDGGFFDED